MPPDIQRVALRKLAQLHAVTELNHLSVPPGNRPEALKGNRALTVDTALRLERYFGWPAEVWLNLQNHHDQQAAKESMKSTLAGIQPCTAISALFKAASR